MEKNQDPGSEWNIPDHFSESLETVFWVKYSNSLKRNRDPGYFRPWIRDGKKSNSVSGINILDPQHCIPHNFKNRKIIYLPRKI
jgi:hypothetical protein